MFNLLQLVLVLLERPVEKLSKLTALPLMYFLLLRKLHKFDSNVVTKLVE